LNGTVPRPGRCDRATGAREAHSIERACSFLGGRTLHRDRRALDGLCLGLPISGGADVSPEYGYVEHDMERRGLRPFGQRWYSGIGSKSSEVSCPRRGMVLAALIRSPTDLGRSLLVASRGGGL
jgi:hypothetical protein